MTNMVGALFCGAVLLALLAPSTPAMARCQAEDLRGRWDYYGIGDVFGLAITADCALLIQRRGNFARSICIERTSGERIRTVNRGELSVRGNCLVEGETNNVCLLEGTMTRNKDAIHGVIDCDTGAISLSSAWSGGKPSRLTD